MARHWVCLWSSVLYFFCTAGSWAAAADAQPALRRTPQSAPLLAQRQRPKRALPSRRSEKVVPLQGPHRLSLQGAKPAPGPPQRPYLSEEIANQRAWLYSAVLPGLGQAYNQQYERILPIYLVFAGLGWGALYYHGQYTKSKRKLLDEYYIKEPQRHNDSLNNYVAFCRRSRDLCLILGALWYTANIFDAYVGSSLKTFNLSNDISLDIQPGLAAPTYAASGMEVSLTFNVRP